MTQIGSSLRSRDEQYLVKFDDKVRIWRILDTWNNELSGLEVEEEVPDDHVAVNILTEGQFIALIKEASQLGILEPALQGQAPEAFEAMKTNMEENVSLKNQLAESEKSLLDFKTRYNDSKETIIIQSKEVDKLKTSVSDKEKLLLRSEGHALKSKALDTVMKLALSEDISKIIEGGGGNET